MPVSPSTRELCAARLLSTLDAVSRISRPRPVRKPHTLDKFQDMTLLCSKTICFVLRAMVSHGASTVVLHCAQVQRDQISTADAAEDAEGQPKPAKRPRLSGQAAAAAAQQGEGATAAAEPASAQQPGASEQPEYLADLSAFVRAAEKAGAQLAVHGMGIDSTTARSALQEAEETVSKLMAGEILSLLASDVLHLIPSLIQWCAIQLQACTGLSLVSRPHP